MRLTEFEVRDGHRAACASTAEFSKSLGPSGGSSPLDRLLSEGEKGLNVRRGGGMVGDQAYPGF